MPHMLEGHLFYRFDVRRLDGDVFVPVIDADGDGVYRACTVEDRTREAAIAAAQDFAAVNPEEHFIVVDADSGVSVHEIRPGSDPYQGGRRNDAGCLIRPVVYARAELVSAAAGPDCPF